MESKKMSIIILVALTFNICYSATVVPIPDQAGILINPNKNLKNCVVNGIIEGTEECDDGDDDNKNECSNQCNINQGWTCIEKTLLDENLSKSQCILIQKCKTYTPNQLTCSECLVNYVLDKSTKSACYDKIINCIQYDPTSTFDNSTCLTCSSGFAVVSPTIGNLCVKQILNCETYQLNIRTRIWECSTCKSGQNCSTQQYNLLTQQITCNLCYLNYQLSLIDQLCHPIINHCMKYNLYTLPLQCNKCYGILKLSQDQYNCTIRSQTIPLCISIIDRQDNSMLCQTCQPYYILLNQTMCIKNIIIPNCLAYARPTDTTTCRLCQYGYALTISGQCTAVIMPQNCLHAAFYYQFLQCTNCIQGYTISRTNNNRPCQKVITPLANCISYYVDGAFNQRCSVCQDGYIRSQDDYCIVGTHLQNCQTTRIYNNGNKLCLLCKPGYIALFESKKCYKVNMPGCKYLKYNNQLNITCIQCQYSLGYLMGPDNKTCIRVTPQMNVRTCIQYMFDNQSKPYCVLCAPGYYLNSNQCIQLDPNCISFDFSLFPPDCLKCKYGVVNFDKKSCFIIYRCLQYLIDPIQNKIACLRCEYASFINGQTYCKEEILV